MNRSPVIIFVYNSTNTELIVSIYSIQLSPSLEVDNSNFQPERGFPHFNDMQGKWPLLMF